FGWVKEGIAVIPRVTSNSRCGRGGTGLVSWHADHVREFQVYCFNSSDVQINSCKPDPSTTTQPSLSASTDSTPYSAWDLPENATAVPTGAEPQHTARPRRFRVVCVSETLP
ncbi:PREDICTED: lymphatic vessel endothelial hyaluronic acid receptor 1, partial [Acanthisitta chloris]|uniref:lymphatic vessel endothelial hyaluronic acid receptor 1 n=1 Tax=Acanthisitta chloris TaxID=57068 RepID=UPI0004F0CC24